MDENGNNTANTRAKFTMEFEAGDILIMADALSIGSTTAHMCQGGGAGDRLRELCNRFLAMSPLPKTYRGEGYIWFEACRALRNASCYEAYLYEKPLSWNRSKKDIIIQVDDKDFVVCEDIADAEAGSALPRINEFLSEIAPFDADRMIRAEVDIFLPDDNKPRHGEYLLNSAWKVSNSVLEGTGIHFGLRGVKNRYDLDRDAAKLVLALPPEEMDRALGLFSAAFEGPDSVPAPSCP